ncbi:MAG: hypothetical protein ABIG89_05635 [Candidatus Woesearchaeota archaeon]
MGIKENLKAWSHNKQADIKNKYDDWQSRRKEISDKKKSIKDKIDEIRNSNLAEEEKQAQLAEQRSELAKHTPMRTATREKLGKGVKAVGLAGGFLLGSAMAKLRSKSAGTSNTSGTRSFHEPTLTTMRLINWFILFSLVFHYVILIQIPNIWTKLIINSFLALITYFIFIPADEKTDGLRELFIVVVWYLCWELFWTTVFGRFYNIGSGIIYGYLLNPFLMPWWFYYAIFIRSKQRTRLSRFLTMGVILLWFAFVIFSIPFLSTGYSQTLTNLGDQGIIPSQVHWDNTKELFNKNADVWWDKVLKKVYESVKNIKLFWYNRLDLATGGDYYTGRVEQSKDEPLGVTIEKVMPADYEFEPDENIVVYGNIKARALDDGINIITGCYVGYKTDSFDRSLPGITGPIGTEYLVFDSDEEDIDCIVQPTPAVQEILKNSKQVTLTAEFNFETMSYLKTYFISQERLRSLTRQGINPLDEFGVKDKNPQAVFTNGPVILGMGTKKPPLSVVDIISETGDLSTGVSSEANLIRLGVTVDNNHGWKGKIKRINQLVIEVPDSMEIVGSTCSHTFTEYTKDMCVDDYVKHSSKPFIQCAETSDNLGGVFDRYNKKNIEDAKTDSTVRECVTKVCENEFDGYKGYQVDVNLAGKSLEDIKQYKTFSCKFKVTNPAELLGTAPITPRYFRSRVRYDYEIEKSTSIRVKKPQTTTGSFGSSSVGVDGSSYGSGNYGVSGTSASAIGQSPEKKFEAIAHATWKSINSYKGSLDSCDLFAVITAISGGNPSYNVGGRKGVMGLSPTITALIAKDLGEDNPNILDSAASIRYGSKLLNDLKSGSISYLSGNVGFVSGDIDPTKTLEGDDIWVVYADTLNSDRLKYDAIEASVLSDCVSKGINKAYLCPDDPTYIKYYNYVSNIKSFREYCKNPENLKRLESVGTSELSPLNTQKFWSSPAKIIVGPDKKEIDASISSKYDIEITKNLKPGADKYQILLKIRKASAGTAGSGTSVLFSKTYTINKDELINQQNQQKTSYEKYPFMRVRLVSANMETAEFVFEVEEFIHTIVDVVVPYNIFVTKTTIWEDDNGIVVQGFYDEPSKSLWFFDKDGNKFCEINIASKDSCSNIPELKIYNHGTATTSPFNGYFEFSPSDKYQ